MCMAALQSKMHLKELIPEHIGSTVQLRESRRTRARPPPPHSPLPAAPCGRRPPTAAGLYLQNAVAVVLVERMRVGSGGVFPCMRTFVVG